MKQLSEYYIKTINMKMDFVIIGSVTRPNKYIEVDCYHPTIFVEDDKKATLVYFSDSGLRTIELSSFVYENRVFKAKIIGNEEYGAVKIKAISLLTTSGKIIGKLGKTKPRR